MLADFGNVVKQAGTDYNPSILANYAYDLVKEYNQFYHDFSILREENEALKVFRLALSQNVGKVVKLAMGLLGMKFRKECNAEAKVLRGLERGRARYLHFMDGMSTANQEL